MSERIGGMAAPSGATTAVTRYASEALQADMLIAGMIPKYRSRAVLSKLGLQISAMRFLRPQG
ncbi:MAG: hypothetical protein IJ074_08575 [Clostridia bacterium]|nr:hypothetical protein [Clostridia bacterium]